MAKKTQPKPTEPVAPASILPAVVSDGESVSEAQKETDYLSTKEVTNKLAVTDAAFAASSADLKDAIERAAAPAEPTIDKLTAAVQACSDATRSSIDTIQKLAEAVPGAVTFKRDARGLVEGVHYHYLPDGKVDWRKMIDPKYIVFRDEKKDEIEKTYGKTLDELSTDEVDDKYLLLLLGGIKDLLKLRGSLSVTYPNRVATPEFVSTDCAIFFMPNFETPQGELFTDGADATPDNVDGWYAKYLTTAAINRAFVRTVRNFLGIYIVGKDEIGPGSKAEEGGRKTTKTGVDGFGPYAMLADLLKKRDRSLDQLKKFLKTKDFDKEHGVDLDAINKLEDFPKDKLFKIVGLIKSS